jgi:putative flippase GtrA
MFSQEYLRILKYIIVGIWNTGFDLALFTFFLNTLDRLPFLKKSSLKPQTISNIFAFLIANSVSYFLNSRFTFSDSHNNRGWIPYLIVSLFTFGLSTVMMQFLSGENLRTKLNLFVRDFKLFSKVEITHKKYIFLIKILIVIITMSVNYFGYKILVF